jgi:endonuclease I
MGLSLSDPPAAPRGVFALTAHAILLTVLVGFWGIAQAVRGAYEPPNPAYASPVGYYNGATGTGTTLRTNLHNIITSGFNSISYGDARYALAITDQDPNNSSDILLVYNRASVSGTWDAGATWNREHLWPQSKLGLSSVGNTYKGPASDLFVLKPCNPSINSGRSNDAYGTPTSTGGYLNSSGYFFPGDADKGDVARSMFYMATRYYNGSGTPSIQNLSLVNGYTIATYQMGDLQSFLHWNYTDGVDNFERRRNQMIYSNTVTSGHSQNNRNPFIDHPEYVWAIFGDSLNDSQISIAPPDSGGTSTANVSLGRIMKNGAFGTSSVTVTKIGADPTTFDLSATGSATTIASGSALVAGAGQPMDYGTQSRTIVAGLNASTGTTGLKSGTISIHNTDLTSSAGGRGSADGDDTINVSGSVLNNRIVTAADIDLGAVHLGASKSGMTTLSTTGDDDHFTHVTVAGQFFNSDSSTGTATISPSLGEVGVASGTMTLTTTGEGLAGESPVNVGVHYTAQVFTGKMAWNLAAGSGNWSTDANWADTQSTAIAGAPGLGGGLSISDTATFDNATAPATVNLNDSSPQLAALTLAGPNAYTIAQGVGGGVLHFNFLHQDTGSASAKITASSGGHQIAAPVEFDWKTEVAVTNPGDTLSLAGSVSNAVALTKTGDGTLDVSGDTHFGPGSSLNVVVGTLRLNVAAGSTVGAGVVASVAAGATLELAGSVSALGPAGLAAGSRPLIKNDGTLSVTNPGSVQVVGGIEEGDAGTGVTSVAAGATLAADHIIQAALVIGGDEDLGGLVTITPSDDLGDPLGAVLLSGISDSTYADSTATGLSLAAMPFTPGSAARFGADSLSRTALGGQSDVPEPASPVLLLIGAGIVAAAAGQSRRKLVRMREWSALARCRRQF